MLELSSIIETVVILGMPIYETMLSSNLATIPSDSSIKTDSRLIPLDVANYYLSEIAYEKQ